MEIMFNELSVIPLCNNQIDANERMMMFSQAIKKAIQSGFSKIRSDKYAHQIELTTEYTLQDWLQNNDVPQRFKMAIYGVFIHPFINLDDELVFEKYDQSKYYFEDVENNIERVECLGLAAAFLYESITISLTTSNVWKKVKLPIIIAQDNQERVEGILNVATKEMFDDQDIASFVENIGELELVETTLKENEKRIHLSDHHGKAELKKLCDRLKRSPYVVEMRSTEWGGNKFIRKIFKDGTLELVLQKPEKRYALWVKTTGRNFRETKAISKILENLFFA